MLVLGIETSCDETAAAVVEDGRRVRSDVVASQILVHAPYGGVVPEVASRQHVATIVPVLRRAVADAGIGFRDLDGIAVTCGPGLVGALLVGVETAKALAYALGKPLVGVNHLAGHLAAVFLEAPGDAGPPPFPHLALLVSGGHTALIRVDEPGTTSPARRDARRRRRRGLRQGRQDAGPRLSGRRGDRQAGGDGRSAGRRAAARARRARRSRLQLLGLKTAVATLLAKTGRPRGRGAGRLLRELSGRGRRRAGAQVAARARARGAARLVVCGGVAANRGLRAALAAAARADGFALFIPPPKRCTDNAAMIAAAGSALFAAGGSAPAWTWASIRGCRSRRLDGASTDDPRRVLARHGLTAKKSWGQNFLRDRAVLARIAAAARAHRGRRRGRDRRRARRADRGARRGRRRRRRGSWRSSAIPTCCACSRAELGGEPRVEIARGRRRGLRLRGRAPRGRAAARRRRQPAVSDRERAGRWR